MRQALHIFKKDMRYLRLEICLTVALAAALPALWPVAAAYLIARVIHAEALPGDSQFWITRPYRWTSLITAKLLFILLFVSLPTCLVQFYQTVRVGFPVHSTWPGLLWSQILIFLCLALPVAALAAITPGIIAFMFFELIMVVIVIGLGQFSFLGLASYRPLWPPGVEWISSSLIISLAAAAAVSILLLQFKGRRTLPSSVAAVGAVVIGVSIFLFLPPRFALETEARLAGRSVDPSHFKLALDPKVKSIFPSVRRDKSTQVQLSFPIVLSGIPDGIDVKADAMAGLLRYSGGKASRLFSIGPAGRSGGPGTTIFNIPVFVDRAFFDEERDQPLTLRASMYLTLFGNARSQTIPRQPAALTVMDKFRCSTGEFERVSQFYCIAAFRWPAKILYAQMREDDTQPFYEMISYSPFPAALDLIPFEAHSTLGTPSFTPPSPLGTSPAPPNVTIIAKQPLAHVRRDLEVRDIRLASFSNEVHFGAK